MFDELNECNKIIDKINITKFSKNKENNAQWHASSNENRELTRGYEPGYNKRIINNTKEFMNRYERDILNYNKFKKKPKTNTPAEIEYSYLYKTDQQQGYNSPFTVTMSRYEMFKRGNINPHDQNCYITPDGKNTTTRLTPQPHGQQLL